MESFRDRLTPAMATGLMVALAVVLLGHLVYWDAMTALIGTAGAILVAIVAVAAILGLAAHLRRAR